MPAEGGSMHRLPPYLVGLCRAMRQALTEPEAWLWTCLRARRLAGAKFRRQRPPGRYIADFCCDEARLVIELDGAVHARQAEYDAQRYAYLASAGYRVLRVPNAEVYTDPEDVLVQIVSALDERRPFHSSSPLRYPLPLGEDW